MNPPEIKSFAAPPIDRREILRYAGCRTETEDVLSLLEDCLREAAPVLTYRAVSAEIPIFVSNGIVRAGEIEFQSASLCAHLAGCRRAVIFAATIGTGFDRLLLRYSRFRPSRALMLQAIGAERIEALCDEISAELSGGTPRFSPGYGDLPLDVQRDLFRILDCERRLGLCLNESMLMSPTKSVTAIVGLRDTV